MRKIVFAEGEIYHIYNRGTDKRDVFLCPHDRLRFINDLCFMNNANTVTHNGEVLHRHLQCEDPITFNHTSVKLVDILAFVIMPNHYHLMLKQRVPHGISAFMHKLGTAYTMYFNRKYPRSGVLFQGRFQAINITKEAHFGYLPFYLHANSLKLYPGPSSIPVQMRLLEEYKWSSYRDYAGIDNFPEVTSRGLLNEYFEQEGGFISYIAKNLNNRQKSALEAQPPKEVEPRYL